MVTDAEVRTPIIHHTKYGLMMRAEEVEAYAAAQVAAERERLTAKIREQADRYFTPRCDQDDHTYGHGLRFAAHLIEEEDD